LTDTAIDYAGVGRVYVAVGVIVDADGQRVLLAKRLAHVHQGDLWEFPGGKVEPGETSSQALARELREELAIEVVCCSPLLEVVHDYADKSVLLDVWQISRFTGQAQGREGQQLCWVAIENLHQFTFPAANRSIVAQLQADLRKPME
jgi:8-oxo-dGTP diphosphatase